MRNLAENKGGISKYIYFIVNFPALDFLIHKMIEQEFQKIFNCSYLYPGYF